MKICFVIHGLSMGGAEKFLINISTYFNSIGVKNDILLLSNDCQLTNELSPDIKIFKFIRSGRYDLSIFKKIKEHVINHDYSTIFCINTYSFFFSRMAFLFDTKRMIVLSPHTTKPFSLYKYIQNLIYCRFIRNSDKVIYLCENQRTFLKKIYFYETRNDNVIYNGIDASFFNPALYSKKERISFRQKYGIIETEKVIVQVARISPEKRHEDSLKALWILHNLYDIKAHLIIVGGGSEKLTNKLKQHIVKLKIDNYVHLEGNKKDVRPYYSISDMFTLTSESETFPISALEALSFGLPCVLTNVGGVKEIISSDLYGSISDVHSPRSIAKEWLKNLKVNHDRTVIRKYLIENFSITTMLEKYRNIIYENTLSKAS